jgi:hypothetical protein
MQREAIKDENANAIGKTIYAKRNYLFIHIGNLLPIAGRMGPGLLRPGPPTY